MNKRMVGSKYRLLFLNLGETYMGNHLPYDEWWHANSGVIAKRAEEMNIVEK